MKKLLLLTIALLVSANASTICGQVDEHQVLSLSCTNGQIITAITYASYGTPTGGCGAPCNSACHATSSQAKLEAACLNSPSCQIRAENGVFGDPCVGTFKRLLVQATCSTPAPFDYGNGCQGDCQKVLEHQSLTLSCAEGVITEVLFASYGKPRGICDYGFSEGWCHATTSQSVVEAACLNQATCTIAAENSVFTDPCVGTFKDLAVAVQCSCPPTYNCNDYPLWNGSTSYAVDRIVRFGGVLYRARVRNTCVDTSNTATWEKIYECPCDCGDLNNWTAQHAYYGGARVAYRNQCWKANWYSLGSAPVNQLWTPWARQGFCTSTDRKTVDCDAYLPYRDTQIYETAGHRVKYGAKLYENRWWVQGENPLNDSWNVVGICQTPYTPDSVDCSGVAVWDADEVYWGSAQVRRGNRLYRARWWTQGDNPVDGGVWEEMNLCA